MKDFQRSRQSVAAGRWRRQQAAMQAPATEPDRSGMEYLHGNVRGSCRVCRLPARSRDARGMCHPGCAAGDGDGVRALVAAVTALRKAGIYGGGT